MKKHLSLLLAAVLTICTLSSCTLMQGSAISDQPAAQNSDPGPQKLQIVTTIFPYYDFARAVAGDLAEIKLLTKPGTEIHSYDPTSSDLFAIQNADLFIYNGGESEAWVEKALSSTNMNSAAVLRMIEHVSLLEAGEEDADHEEDPSQLEHAHGYDEHIWTSPYNAELLVNEIANALSEIDPDHAQIYERNAQEYRVSIAAVTAQIKQTVENAPDRHIIVADRFPLLYFTEAFGLTYDAALPGCDVQGDASPAVILDLIETIKEQEIKAVFTIELSNERAAKTISDETGTKILRLHSCQNISKEEFENGETYLSLLAQNAAALKEALA